MKLIEYELINPELNRRINKKTKFNFANNLISI